MRAIRLFRVGLLAAATLLAAQARTQTATASVVVDSINQTAAPAAGITWAATEVGWFYTPGFGYVLDGIETKFGTGDARTVTVEVYDAWPGAGGVLLRSAGFTPVGGVFSGGSFAPLSLVAGEEYFFGFRNVGGLEVNVTVDAGATNLPGGLQFSFSNDGSYALGPETGFTAQPIVQFLGPQAVVPEPSTLALAGLGGLGLAGLIRRRRRA